MTPPTLDPSVPIPGRTFYAGRWRTPEEIERVRARKRQQASTPTSRAQRSKAYRKRYANDPAFRERELARNRARYEPRERSRITDTERRRRRRVAQIEKRRATRKPPKVSEPRRAPADIRALWNKAEPGSIIRRKYPTREALDRRFAA